MQNLVSPTVLMTRWWMNILALLLAVCLCHTWTIQMALEPTVPCSIQQEYLEEVIVPLKETLSLDDTAGPA